MIWSDFYEQVPGYADSLPILELTAGAGKNAAAAGWGSDRPQMEGAHGKERRILYFCKSTGRGAQKLLAQCFFVITALIY